MKGFLFEEDSKAGFDVEVVENGVEKLYVVINKDNEFELVTYSYREAISYLTECFKDNIDNVVIKVATLENVSSAEVYNGHTYVQLDLEY